MILCGGRGTRIRDVAEDVPKPMIEIGGLPVLWHIMKYYAAFGHREFVLCLGYKGLAIKNFFLNYDAHTRDITVKLGRRASVDCHGAHDEQDWTVTLAETGLDAMTGARVARARRYVDGGGDFMLTYGDGVGNIDIERLLKFHRSHGRVMTVTGVRPPGRFGELMCDANGRVTEFNEKPQATAGMISGGFFVCRSELFGYLDERDELVLEQEPMRRLVGEGELMVYPHEGFWQPMDTHRDWLLLNRLYDAGKAPWRVW
jgi:glucose-1-phosphate cytidylyltransferase